MAIFSDTWVLLCIIGFFFLVGLLFNNFWQKLNFNKESNEYLSYLTQLKEGQQKLFSTVEILSNNHNSSQAQLMGHIEGRLSEVQKQIFDSLSGSATKTAQSQQRTPCRTRIFPR